MQQINNSKRARSSGKTPLFIKSILTAQGGYFADALYAFRQTKDNSFLLQATPPENNPSLRWLILGREHYFETTKEYPIANKQDLKQALRFDDNKGPFQGITLQHIERVNEQSHRVTFWIINPKVIESLSYTPWLILPESYLLVNTLNKSENIATITGLNKTLFISKTGQGVFSGVQSPQIANIESFAFSTGTSLDEDKHLITKSDDFSNLLLTGIKSLNHLNLSNFLVINNDFNWQSYPWKKAGVITSVVFGIYLALSSAWLVIEQQKTELLLAEKKEQVNQALVLQKSYKQKLQWQKLLIEPLNKSTPYWNTWPIILDAASAGATFTAIHYKNDKIIIHGITGNSIKATDILAKLSENSSVGAAEFSQPVTNNRNQEKFAISFSFAKQVSIETTKPLINETASEGR